MKATTLTVIWEETSVLEIGKTYVMRLPGEVSHVEIEVKRLIGSKDSEGVEVTNSREAKLVELRLLDDPPGQTRLLEVAVALRQINHYRRQRVLTCAVSQLEARPELGERPMTGETPYHETFRAQGTLAWMAREDELKLVHGAPADPDEVTIAAALMFDIPISQVTALHRNAAKTATFGARWS